MTKSFLGFLLIVLLNASTVFAQNDLPNWSTWRGPNGNGSVDNANPPLEWNLKKNIKWKVEIPGKGKSTPIIWGNQVIVLTAVPTNRVKEAAAPGATPAQNPSNSGRGGGGSAPTNYHQFKVMSFDRSSGAKQWEKTVQEAVPHEAGHQTNTFSSSSALTDGNRIYAFFGSQGLYCLDMQGQIKWKKELGKMNTVLGFGEGATPALFEGTLVVPWDHEGDSFLFAFDAVSGDEKWKTVREKEGSRGTTWGTPLIVKHKGRTQVIMNGTTVRSYDLADGKLIWQCGGQVSNPIPTPIVFGDHVICMTGFKGDANYSISLDSQGDVTNSSSSVAWKRTDAGSYVASAVLYKGQLYFTRERNNIAFSVDAKTGEAIFGQARLPGISEIYSSPVAAADRIYFTGRDGTTVVIKHGPKMEVLATNSLDETVDSSLAIVGNTIFARGEKTLFCISEG